jgi:hypothetical protein
MIGFFLLPNVHLFYFILFIFAVLGFELRAYTSPFFVKDIFEIGSHKPFAQAGLKLLSS